MKTKNFLPILLSFVVLINMAVARTLIFKNGTFYRAIKPTFLTIQKQLIRDIIYWFNPAILLIIALVIANIVFVFMLVRTFNWLTH